MGLSKLFKSKRNKDKDSSIEETVISSDMPYTLGKTVDDDCRQEFKTFTENWIMKTDATGKDVSIPVKVTRNDCGMIMLDLYLPDSITCRNYQTVQPDHIGSLWLYLDNQEFFIIFTEFIDPFFDENGVITHFRLNLGETGFHSELKRLNEKYSPIEICHLVCEKLSIANIIEFEPKIISPEDQAPQCPTVSISSPTASILRKAFEVVGYK
ncbi:MAG: hypothetical protein J5995_08985 [Muribaculaceae bacterium]|nr:hypothetical protein [Muribaculaceae bacterium]